MHWVWGGADDRVNLDADFAYLVRIEAEVRSADSSRSSTCSASTIWMARVPCRPRIFTRLPWSCMK